MLINQINLFNNYIIKNYKYLTYSSIQHPQVFYQNSIPEINSFYSSPPNTLTILPNKVSKPITSNKPECPIVSNIAANPVDTINHLNKISMLEDKIRDIEINNQEKMNNLIEILNNKIKLINNIII